MAYQLEFGVCKDLSRAVLLDGPLVLAEQVQAQARLGYYLNGSVSEAIITDQAVIIDGAHYTAELPAELFTRATRIPLPAAVGQLASQIAQCIKQRQHLPTLLINNQVRPYG
jgi:hypothetical protein